MSPALTSTTPLPRIFRVARNNPTAVSSETELRSIGEAAIYLSRDFTKSYEGNLGWRMAAAALEDAARDARRMPHLMRALDYFLGVENRILLPKIDGQFVPFN